MIAGCPSALEILVGRPEAGGRDSSALDRAWGDRACGVAPFGVITPPAPFRLAWQNSPDSCAASSAANIAP